MNKYLLLLLLISTNTHPFDWQGHRGARGLYPENTLNGMYKALEFPIETLEFDVVISLDKKIVVSHEPWANPDICVGAKGRSVNLFKMNYEDIKKLDCGSIGNPRFPEQQKVKEYKPLLSEVINEVEKKFASRKIFYNIELKSTVEQERDGQQPPYQEFTDLVMAKMENLLPVNRYSIQSFDFRVLKYMNAKYPEIRSVALVYEKISAESAIKKLGFTPNIYSPYYKNVTSRDIKFCKERNIPIIPWTVNDVKDMKRLKEMGVDGIITDYPDRIF